MANPSKFLSLVLRHQPDRIGLELDGGGWASVDDLVAKAREHGVKIDRCAVLLAVDENDKQRFALSPDRMRVRAVQGHSITVDLGLVPTELPVALFHGTATRFLESIWASGLEPRSRQHVHLSSAVETARTVGARHGKPAILRVDAAAMIRNGREFFLAENGVWLTASVPAQFLKETSL